MQITVAETVGVEQRGRYYEHAGALRDMVANHLFQLLSLIAMEPPSSFEAEAVRDEKGKVLRAMQPLSPEEVLTRTVRGQYGEGGDPRAPRAGLPGRAARRPAVDHRDLRGLEARIDNWRWADVPFYLRTGKRLPAHHTDIAITFRRPPHRLFRGTEVADFAPNVLILHLQPDEGISLSFQAKVPGPVVKTGSVEMDFNYADHFGRTPEHRLRDAALRLHVRRPHALPARGQRGGRLGRGDADPGCLEGAPRRAPSRTTRPAPGDPGRPTSCWPGTAGPGGATRPDPPSTVHCCPIYIHFATQKFLDA